MVAFVFYTCVQSHAASGLAAPIFDAISIVSCCKRRSRYSAIHTFSMCRCACAYTLFGSGARRFVFLCALAQIMDAIFAKAKKISDSVFAADTKAETTFDQDDNLPSWKTFIGGPLLEAPTTPPFNAASIPLDADDVLSQRPISPPLRQPRLPTPKCVARKNVLAAQHLAQITAVDEFAPFEFEPARGGSPTHCEESPSTEYEAFEPACVDEPFVPAVDVASENDSAWTAYPTAPWHTAATSSFHRELSANSTTGAAAPTTTMWHDVEENTERSEAYTCSRLNTAGRPRPRGGKKREREASHHGSNCPPRVQSTRPAGIVVAPPNRS